MTIKELKFAIDNKLDLVWNDPLHVEGNDYRISFIEKIEDDHDFETPLLITYNGGFSEAQAFAHEISTARSKEELLTTVIDQIREDLAYGELEALEELLNFIPYENLMYYTSESTWYIDEEKLKKEQDARTT